MNPPDDFDKVAREIVDSVIEEYGSSEMFLDKGSIGGGILRRAIAAAIKARDVEAIARGLRDGAMARVVGPSVDERDLELRRQLKSIESNPTISPQQIVGYKMGMQYGMVWHRDNLCITPVAVDALMPDEDQFELWLNQMEGNNECLQFVIDKFREHIAKKLGAV